MKQLKKIFLLIIFILFQQASLPSNYYIDSQNGDDNQSGTTEKQAWKTIAKVNSRSFKAGDNIYFKSGSLWRERLNISSSGSDSSPITISTYGGSEPAIISGADILTNFQQHSGSIWKQSSQVPRSVFFDDIRGIQRNSLSALKNERDWYYSGGYLYIMGFNPANSYSKIEGSIRGNSINVTGKNIVIKGLRLEKTFHDALFISSSSENVIADGLEIIQWTDEINSSRGGAAVFGKNCVVKNSSFGRNTNNSIADQNWAGFVAIIASGTGTECAYNKIYHNSIENENANGKYGYGIRINSASGKIKIHHNTIYHTASNGILADTYTKAGDELRIYENKISYTGQAGISAYKTRAADGIGGKGYVYKNDVSYANRLGGETGSGGNRAAGIHFNDGIQHEVNPSQPFIKWYCYENTVHRSQSLNERNSPDSDGIAVDFNANGVEIYRNLVYNCDGKGIYVWNADNTRIYYNILYGNDCGITVTGSGKGNETTDNNEVFNNVLYKNYNGDEKGPNYDTEIYFGLNGNNNKFVNNILYASKNGSAYFFNKRNSTGCFADYNLVFSENGSDGNIGVDGSKQNFKEWRANHPNWDRNTLHADPQFKNAAEFDFRLKGNSPAINNGTILGNLSDFVGLPVIDKPDIGAFETSL